MPGSRRPFRPSRQRAVRDPAPSEAKPQDSQLMLVDNARLQNAAWADFHSARKRLEKASGDLHRHEQVDTPEYDKWLHLTFPTLITKLRQLHEDVSAKSHKVQYVQHVSMLSGRSPKKVWRELKAEEAKPQSVRDEEARKAREEEEEFGDANWDEFFEDELPGQKKPRARIGGGKSEGGEAQPPASSHGNDARSIYRRLVQRLHPDRGGEWSAARKRLWNEVQLAWESRDADWLARLEVEWETSHDILGPTSALSRLRAGIAQLIQARRDIERKLRGYRQSPPWRFTLSEKKRESLGRQTEEVLKDEIKFLERQLAYLNSTIAAWDRPAGMARTAEFDREPAEAFPQKRRPRR